MAVEARVSGSSTRGKVVLVAQQISFAKTLAGNVKRLRERALKKLKKYLTARSTGKCCFTEDDLMRIWKGLYYCMWMADKPLVQENIADEISNLIHCFKPRDMALLFIKTFFTTMALEWYGLDQHRVDKFLMFVRRFLRQCLEYCKTQEWDVEFVTALGNVFNQTVLPTSESIDNNRDLGLILHFIGVFLEELAKSDKGNISEDVLLEFLRPFVETLCSYSDSRVTNEIVDRIFKDLIRQTDLGVEYEEKLAAWKKAGCPGRGYEDMQLVEEDTSDAEADEEMEEDERNDPRAGEPAVVLPRIHFDPNKVVDLLSEYRNKPSSAKLRKCLNNLISKFQDLSKSVYPLQYKYLSKEKFHEHDLTREDYETAAEDYLNFQQSMMGEKKRKRKKRESASSKRQKLEKECEEEQEDDIPEVSVSSLGQIAQKHTAIKLKPKKDNIPTDKPTLYANVFLGKKKRKSLEKATKAKRKKSNKAGRQRRECGENIGNSGALKSMLGNEADTTEQANSENRMIFSESVPDTAAENRTGLVKEKRIIGLRGKSTKGQKARKEKRSYSAWNVSSDTNVTNTAVIHTQSPNKDISETPKLSLMPPGALTRQRAIKSTANSGKRVNIALQLNKSQGFSEYEEAVKLSPSIPYDANKLPGQGVLKPSAMKSPINPFYRPPKGINWILLS